MSSPLSALPTTIPASTTAAPTSLPLQIFTSIRYDPLLATHPPNNLFDAPNPFYMLAHHRDRLLAAAQHFNWPQACSILSSDKGLKTLTQTLTQTVHDATATVTADTNTSSNSNTSSSPAPNPGPLRIRILVSPTGTITTESSPTPPVALTQLFPPSLDLNPPTHLPPSSNNAPTTTPRQPWHILLDTHPTPPTPYTSHKTTHRTPYTSARIRAGIPSFTSPIEVLLYNPAGEVMEGSLTSVYFSRGGKWVTPGVESGGNRGTTRRWALDRGLCVEGCVRVESVRGGERIWVSNGVRGFFEGVVWVGAEEGEDGEREGAKCEGLELGMGSRCVSLDP